MAGWFEAFSNFARGAAPALDRYQTLRRLDDKSQSEDRQQAFENSLKQQQLALQQDAAARQKELTDLAILGKQQELATQNLMPGQNLDAQGMQSLRDAKLGSLINSVHQFNPMEQTSQHSNPFGGMPQYNLNADGPATEAVASPQDLGPQYQMPDAPRTDFDRYLGTGQQQMDMYKLQAPERQQMRLMTAVTNSDMTNPNDLGLLGSMGMNVSPFVANLKPPTTIPGGTAGYLMSLDPEHQKAYLQAAGAYAAATRDPNKGGGADKTAIPVFKKDSAEGRLANDLAYGKATFTQFNRMLSSRGEAGAAQRAGIYDLARQINPNFDPAGFEAGYKFATTPANMQALTAIDSVLPNIDKFIELGSAVQNGDATQLNKLLNSGKYAFGNRKVTNAAELGKIVGDELGVALGRGTVTDMSRQLGLDLANMNLSPANLASTMSIVKEALMNRRNAYLPKMGPYAGMLPGVGEPPASHGAPQAQGGVPQGPPPAGTKWVITPAGDAVAVPNAELRDAIAAGGKVIN